MISTPTKPKGLLLLFLLLASVSAGVAQWTLESQYPPEFDYPRAVVVDEYAYAFTSMSSGFDTPVYEVLDQVWTLDTNSFLWASQESYGSIPPARDEYCLVAYLKKIYMVGGYVLLTNTYSDEIYEYDIESREWRKIEPIGKSMPGRYAHSCFVWQEGIYVYGGEVLTAENPPSMWRFSLAAGSWSEIVYATNSPKQFNCLGVFHNRTFYTWYRALGSSSTLASSIWSFDVGEKTWKMEMVFPDSESINRMNMVTHEGKIFSFGGGPLPSCSNRLRVIKIDTMEMVLDTYYYPSRQIVPFPIISPPARVHSFLLASRTHVIAFGGRFVDQMNTYPIHNDFWVLDPASFEWVDSSLSRYPLPRRSSQIINVSNGSFAMIGGEINPHNAGQYVNDLWMFELETKRWVRLSQESTCLPTNSSCLPLLKLPSVGYFNKTIFIIGGLITTSRFGQPIARTFSIDTRVWNMPNLGSDYLECGGRVYDTQYASMKNTLYIWGGFSSVPPSGAMNQLCLLDMQTLETVRVIPQDRWPSARSGGLGFVWGSEFCFHGGYFHSTKTISNEIWCYVDAEKNWSLISDNSTRRILGHRGATVAHGVPVTYGGETFKSSEAYESIFYDGKWTEAKIRDFWPKAILDIAATKIGSLVFVFAGMTNKMDDSKRTSLLYSLNIAHVFCGPLDTIKDNNGVITDGSGEFGYFPSTDCTWEFSGPNWIRLSSFSILEKATLTMSLLDECDDPFKINGSVYKKIVLKESLVGVPIFTPSPRFRISFQVDDEAQMGDGFEIEYFTCNLGYIIDASACICPNSSFVSFRRECVPCPLGMIQSPSDQTTCFFGSPPEDQDLYEREGSGPEKSTPIPGQMLRLHSGPPPVLYGAAAVITGSVYLVGGRIGSVDDGIHGFQAMDKVFVWRSSVQNDWAQILIGGEIPSGRSRHCFVSMTSYAVLIGGETLSDDDKSVYFLDPLNRKWERKGRAPFLRSGSVCVRKGDGILVYGGKQDETEVANDIWMYDPGSDLWSLLSENAHNPRISNAAGSIFDGKLVIFSGTNGTHDYNRVHFISLDDMSLEAVEIVLGSCVFCDEDGDECFFGRQDFSMGQIGSDLHIFGGTSNGRVWHDVIVYSLETNTITRRINYEWDIPSLPIQYPPPKYGSAFLSTGDTLMIIGGSAGPGLASGDTWSWSMGFQTWSDTSIVRTPMHRAGASVSKIDKQSFVMFGGWTIISEEVLLNDVWQFNTVSGRWVLLFRESESTQSPPPRSEAALLYIGNTLHVLGGRTYSSTLESRLWSFSLATKSWTNKALPNTGRNYHPFNRVGMLHVETQSQLFVLGGEIFDSIRGAERYTPVFAYSQTKNSSFSPTGQYLHNRKYASISPIGTSSLLVIGGISFDGQLLQDGWILHLEKQTWTPFPLDRYSELKQGISHATTSSGEGNTIIFGGYTASGISNKACMIQHDFHSISELHIEKTGEFSGFVEQTSLTFDDRVYLLGGKSNFALTGDIFIYRPGFCTRNGLFISSGFRAKVFDDGSKAGNYLQNTNCTWVLPSATQIRIHADIRKHDKFEVYEWSGSLDEKGMLIYAGTGNGTIETGLFSTSGFLVHFEASNADIMPSKPCDGCLGFEITHAACPVDSALIGDVCVCMSGYYYENERCLPCQSGTSSPDCPASYFNGSDNEKQSIVIGTSLGVAFLVCVGLLVLIAKVHKNKVASLEKKLYVEIDFEEIKLGDIIGAGSFGEVYRGEWRGADVAIKRLLAKKVDKESLTLFMDEVSVMVELRHPNILLYMGASVNLPNLCLVCELMSANLSDVLQNTEISISFTQKIKFMIDTAKGMLYLHTSKPPIIHRDLKTPNLLLDENWRVKISDFGLTTKQEAVRSQEIAGSLLWLAPEVIMGGEYKDYSDVYSFGIIIWEIMTRKVPYYEIESSLAVAALVSMKQRRPLIEEASISQPVQEIMEQCWAHDPPNRPTFAVAVKSIQQILKQSESVTSSQSWTVGSKFMPIEYEGNRPPKWPSGDVCFAVIQLDDAESLWDDIPKVICEALLMASDIVRECLHMENGLLARYEGDSFLCVFHHVDDGIRFSINLQERLWEADWSEAVLSHSACADSKDWDIKGPRFKIVLHFGPSIKEEMRNQTPQYMGKIVNDAIRLCLEIPGGASILTEEVFQQVAKELLTANDIFFVPYLHRSRDSQSMNLKQITSSILKKRLNMFSTCKKGQSLIAEDKLKANPQKLINSEINTTFDTSVGDSSHEASIQMSSLENKCDTNIPSQKSIVEEYPDASVQNKKPLSISKRKTWEVDWNDLTISKTPIGWGSYGTVFRGEYQGQKVAIKRMLHQNKTDEYFIAFMSEVSTIRKLCNPNIVQFVGACFEPPNISIVMVLVEPGNLRDVLQDQTTTICSESKMSIIRSIVSGMSYLHSLAPPLIHRDLKTSNILVDQSFNAYICDFGFARVRVQNRTMTKCGTISYQAPEVIEGKRYSEKADVYSFAIVLWELETRKIPYAGCEGLSTSLSVVHGSRLPLPSNGNEKVLGAIQRCWSRNPEERPSFLQLKQEF